MSLNRLFDSVGQIRETAHWRAAFGEPVVAQDKTLIPVARVGYSFGLGFGNGPGRPEAEGESTSGGAVGGGGGGGGASAKPLGALVVTPDCVYFEPVRDEGKIILCSLGVAALFIFQLTRTLRVIFGRK
jgi:uncharacterized spore protein YtfJ